MSDSPYRGRRDRDRRDYRDRDQRGRDSHDRDSHGGSRDQDYPPRDGGQRHFRDHRPRDEAREYRQPAIPVSARQEPWVELRGPMRGPRVWHDDVGQRSDRHPVGTQVAVYDRDGAFRGWGLWHPHARIAVRMVTHLEKPLEAEDWQERARAAIARRRLDPSIPLEVCRIFHAEGDDFPALVVDRYQDVLAIEIYASAMVPVLESILPTLHEELGTQHHRICFDDNSARAEGIEAFEKRSAGCPPRLQFEENGLTYEVFLTEGHKTGFFCDQRDNRARVGDIVRRLVAAERPPRVLDICSYTGGFALNAAAAGASEVRGIDLDEKAVEQAKRNANLNQLKQVKFTHADAFSYLRQLARNGETYDLIIVDPPKFIPNRRVWEEGIARYHDINKLAMPLLAEHGQLLSCSCSGLLDSLTFQQTLRRAARLRPMRILAETGAGPDHPVRLDFPEGRYLKAVWMQAD